MKNISLRLPDISLLKLDAIAKSKNISRSELLKDIIENYFNENKKNDQNEIRRLTDFLIELGENIEDKENKQEKIFIALLNFLRNIVKVLYKINPESEQKFREIFNNDKNIFGE